MADQELPIDTETRATAIIGAMLASGIMSALKRRGDLSEVEVADIYSTALSGLEGAFPISDAGVQAARVMLEQMAKRG